MPTYNKSIEELLPSIFKNSITNNKLILLTNLILDLVKPSVLLFLNTKSILNTLSKILFAKTPIKIKASNIFRPFHELRLACHLPLISLLK